MNANSEFKEDIEYVNKSLLIQLTKSVLENQVFQKTRSIIEAAFYGNNVVKVNTLKEAYELAKNSPGTIVTDMPVYRGEEFGLEKDAKVLLFNDGAVTGRYAAARRIKRRAGSRFCKA